MTDLCLARLYHGRKIAQVAAGIVKLPRWQHPMQV